jgi:hypothetical protein
MPEWTPLAWLAIVTVVGLNGFAAGVVALLHIWRHGMRRRTRILLAGAAAGLLLASPLLTFAFGEVNVSGEPLVLVVLVVLMSAFAAAASLPGAVIIARKLEGPGGAFRAFE